VFAAGVQLRGGARRGAVILLLAKNRQRATQFSENGIFGCKFPVFEDKFRQKATENWFFGDGVATFMPTGYSFQSFLK
jgi:hypothetical protein